MSIELEDAKTKVAQFQKQCEEYLVVIVQQKRDADEQQKVKSAILHKLRLQNTLFFLSFFFLSVLVILMRDAGMCAARIKGSHSSFKRLSPVPLVIFTLVPDPS